MKEFSVYGDDSRDTIIFCKVDKCVSEGKQCRSCQTGKSHLGSLVVGRRVTPPLGAANLRQRPRRRHLRGRHGGRRLADSQRLDLAHHCKNYSANDEEDQAEHTESMVTVEWRLSGRRMSALGGAGSKQAEVVNACGCSVQISVNGKLVEVNVAV